MIKVELSKDELFVVRLALIKMEQLYSGNDYNDRTLEIISRLLVKIS